jgi:hypothetical protein
MENPEVLTEKNLLVKCVLRPTLEKNLEAT